MHKAPDEEAKNADRLHLRREDQTAQHSAAEAENAHRWHLHREYRTARGLAAEAESIAHSRRHHREDQTVQRLAAVTTKSSQVPPASSVLPIASRVTRSQCKAPTEALTASAATGDPFTYAEAMESPQRDHWKRALKEESR